MKQQELAQARRRLYRHILRSGCILVVCLVGPVACLQDSNDRVVLDAPSPTVRRARDVRPTITPPTRQPPTPAPATPTFVPSSPRS
jgi:hypothetical protein